SPEPSCTVTACLTPPRVRGVFVVLCAFFARPAIFTVKGTMLCSLETANVHLLVEGHANINKESVMNRLCRKPSGSFARLSFLAGALAVVSWAVSVGQAQVVVPKTKAPVQKSEAPKQTAQPDALPLDVTLRNKVALTSTFKAERVGDKIILKSTVSCVSVAAVGKAEDGRYAIYRWKGSDWDRVALQSGPIS